MRRRQRSVRLGVERCEARALLAADGLPEIALSSARVAENRPVGAVVGELSVGDVGGFSFALAAGDGGADNALFRVDGSQLRTNAVFDFEVRRSFSVRVRAADAAGVAVEQPFTIGITDVNDAPTGIRLTKTQLEAGQPAGTVVGNLETIDQDAVAVIQIMPPPALFRYELVAGPGDRNNASFTVARDVDAGVDQLKTAAVLPAGGYSIRIRSTDFGGLSVDRVLAIRVVSVNRPPEAVALANVVASMDEGVVGPRPVKVADIVVTDDGQGTNSIRLSGADAARFMVLSGGLCLRPGTRLDFETKPVLDVTVTVQDVRLPASQPVTVNSSLALHDVDERPTIRPLAMLVGGMANAPFAIDYAALVGALNAFDPEGRPLSFVVQGVSAGALQRFVKTVAPDGAESSAWVSITADAPLGQRTITATDQFRWLPPANVRGARPALRLRAWDGANESLQTATVSVALG